MKIIKQLKRYSFFAVLLMLNIAFLIYKPELGKASLTISIKNFREMLTILPPVFILMGLMDVWIPKQTLMRYMGKGAGAKGGMIAFLLGSFSAGPLYAAFPIAAILMKKGVSPANIFIFIGTWSTAKIPMMMFEITQLGVRFALLRYSLSLMGIILVSLILDKTTNEEERQKIQELAYSQMDECK